MTFDVKLPNGQIARATYRNDSTDAVFVRVNGVTVSGAVQYVGGLALPTLKFVPSGQNAHMVR